MKAIIMLGSIICVSGVLAFFFDRISIMETYFNLTKSPVWCDVVFLLLGLLLVVQRGTAIFNKWF